MSSIQIPLSKTKLLFGIGGSILFVALGLYLLTTISDQQTKLNPTMVIGVGISCILFFGAIGIYGITKMLDKTVGLTIDENGIFDNTNAPNIGLIKWSDITSVKTKQVASTRLLLIYTVNPDFYLDKAKGIKRKLMEKNSRIHGTPLSITSNTLKCNLTDLEKTINNRLQHIQRGTPPHR